MGDLVELPPPAFADSLRRLIAEPSSGMISTSGVPLTLEAFDEAIESVRNTPYVPPEPPPLPPAFLRWHRWYEARKLAPWYRPRAFDGIDIKRRHGRWHWRPSTTRPKRPGGATRRRARVTANSTWIDAG